MSPIFKVLTSIAAWVLFVGGLMGIVWCTAEAVGLVEQEDLYLTATFLVVNIAALFLSVVIMKLRQTLE